MSALLLCCHTLLLTAVPDPAAQGAKAPRRALLISVNNYLYYNPLDYGRPAQPKENFAGSSTAALRTQLTRPALGFAADQVLEQSDAAAAPHSVRKEAIEATIKSFLGSCRRQDRVLLFFAGHACEREQEVYLIPIEGHRDEPASLIPLRWLYAQLAQCRAQQKVLVLDVYRFPPARGFELPGTGEGERGTMTLAFEKLLRKPPPGVQVWLACGAGQNSVELDSGSAFLQALLRTLQDPKVFAGKESLDDPLPLADLLAGVNRHLKPLLASEKLTQAARLIGQAGAAADGTAPGAPPRPALQPPPPPGGGAASFEQVDEILEEIRLLPPARATHAGEANLLHAVNLPAFPARVLGDYGRDGYKSVAGLRDRFKKTPAMFRRNFPLRAAVFEAATVLESSQSLVLHEALTGPLNAKTKAAVLKEQQRPAEMIFKLEQTLGEMRALAEENRLQEKSNRWRAHFDYALVRVASRLLFLLEYNYLLASIRADRLPELTKGQTGWRLAASAKVTINEAKAKQLAKEIGKLCKGIETDYPQTPWAVLARREAQLARGLEWRARSD